MGREATTTAEPVGVLRRELYKDRTRLDLAVAAFELAKAEGLAAVRVPRVAAVVGVSPRTFNNYCGSGRRMRRWVHRSWRRCWASTGRRARMAFRRIGCRIFEHWWRVSRPCTA